MEKLHGWVFTYNTFTKTWGAAKRENYHKLFNDYKSKDVIRSKSFLTLQELIIRTDGNQVKLKKLTGEKV